MTDNGIADYTSISHPPFSVRYGRTTKPFALREEAQRYYHAYCRDYPDAIVSYWRGGDCIAERIPDGVAADMRQRVAVGDVL